MVPYPRHSSIDSALHSKRPVNRTAPLLHRGFGADRKVLPIFLVFHPLAAHLAPRSNVQPRHSDSWFGHRIPGGTLPDNSGRSIPPDERDQFRIHWWQGNNQLTYKDNTKKELFHRIVYIFYAITIFGKFFHEIVLLSHRQFTCKIFEYPQNVFF